MTGTLRIVAILCALIGTADAGHGGRGGGGGGGGVVRDHRVGGGGGGGGGMVRDHRGPIASRGPAVRDHRGGPVAHVRVSNGRYVFPGGVVRVYHRPVIRAHYYNIHMRPALIVEPYDPVPGYVWVHGGWNWGGAEWVWTPGYFAEASAPVVSGGVNVSAGISIH